MRSKRPYFVALLISLSPGPIFAGPLPETFTLGQYIPDDCWMYTHVVNNPDARFISEHWAPVFEALKNSGIENDLRNFFIGILPTEDDRAAFDAFWQRSWDLVRGVRWGDLVDREFAFAQRYSNPMMVPDVIFLCRPKPATLDANVQGLKAILDNLASLSDTASVTQEELHGAAVWSLNIVNVPFTFHLFNKDDVVGIIMGQRALRHTLALLEGTKGPTAIVDSPRFTRAVAEVPPPEDSVAYFDAKRLVADLQKSLAPMAPPPDSAAPTTKPCSTETAHVRQVVRVLIRALDSCDVLDYAVITEQTDGLQRIAHSVTRLQKDYKAKPLGRVLGTPSSFERFDRYVPVDATAFHVSSGIDLGALYKEVLSFIQSSCNEGDAMLARWDALQAKIGFNLQADLLSWLGRESVTFYLPGKMMTAFGPQPDWVVMLRVKDSNLAAEKVNAGITRLNALLQAREQALLITPATSVQAEGFQNVTHPLLVMFLRLTIGVWDDWLIIGSSESAVNKCLDTAAGKVQTVTANARFQKEGVVPTGPVCSASFEDMSRLGQDLSAVMGMMALFSLSVPDEPGARPIKALLNSLAKLAPALGKIDFLSSTSTASTFDGQAWTAKTVTTYKPPKPAAPTPADTPATAPVSTGR
ncbi:MAG: hypothetical protein JSV19_08625 [Phycisphaerales bacterium]|nr:MAG: hypothetical protein JSV19_08625 [Phycisphaerales bacterium]